MPQDSPVVWELACSFITPTVHQLLPGCIECFVCPAKHQTMCCFVRRLRGRRGGKARKPVFAEIALGVMNTEHVVVVVVVVSVFLTTET